MTTSDATQRVMSQLEDIGKNQVQNENEFHAASGLVLRMKRVPQFLIKAALDRVKEPKVPVVHVEEKGRDEPNPNDPAYIEAVAEYRASAGDEGLNILLMLGTEILEIPENLVSVSSDTWSNDITDVTGIEVPEGGKRRYLAWLKYYAMGSYELQALGLAISRYTSLIPQSDVEDVVEGSFRPTEARNPPNGVHAEENGGDGNTHSFSPDSGDDLPVRSDGSGPLQLVHSNPVDGSPLV